MTKTEKENMRQLLRCRQECLARYNRWEAKHRERLSAAEAVRRIGNLYEMMPEEAKKKDINTKIEGIRRMHQAFARFTGERH